MRSLYLILAATAVVVTSEPQRTNNDIIWYPVDDEEGVFISTFGEKHRTPPELRSRSHRRARFSGLPAPLPYDPTENRDPSFFHNINERRTQEFVPPIPKVPPAFLNQDYPQSNSLQSQNFGDTSFQEIYNEVFDYKQPLNEYPKGTNRWNGRPNNINQWGNQRPVTSTQNQWGFLQQRPITNTQNQWNNGNKRPVINNQWGSQANNNQNQWGFGSQTPTNNQNQWGNQRPVTNNQNQWGNQRPVTNNQNQWGNQRPVMNNQNQWGGNSFQRPETGNQWGSSNFQPQKPGNAEWFVPNNTNKPSKRPPNESDKLVFPGETSGVTTSPSDVLPTDPPTLSPCEMTCPVTPEFNPVCGSDGTTYTNAGRLKCAQMCGKNVRLSHHGNCGRTPLVTPLLSNNPFGKLKGFF